MFLRKSLDDQAINLDDLSIRNLTQAIEASPNEYGNYWTRGLIYDHLGRYQQAVSDYTRVIAINPKFSNAYINRAADYADLGDFSRGLTDLDIASKLDLKLAIAYAQPRLLSSAYWKD